MSWTNVGCAEAMASQRGHVIAMAMLWMCVESVVAMAVPAPDAPTLRLVIMTHQQQSMTSRLVSSREFAKSALGIRLMERVQSWSSMRTMTEFVITRTHASGSWMNVVFAEAMGFPSVTAIAMAMSSMNVVSAGGLEPTTAASVAEMAFLKAPVTVMETFLTNVAFVVGMAFLRAHVIAMAMSLTSAGFVMDQALFMSADAPPFQRVNATARAPSSMP